ncbi:proteasome-activating nucleotidase [Bacteroidota bacterium]
MSRIKTKEDLEKTMFSYTVDSNGVEEENKLLRETVNQLKNEVEKFKTPALLVGEVIDLAEDNAVVRLPNGNSFLVEISNSIKDLNPGESVLLEQKNLTVVDRISKSKKFNVEQFVIVEKPILSWKDIGGLHEQIEDIKEVIELPLLKPDLFKKVGIQPPKGILLYGPPGTGKTLLAKAVAASTHSTFIEIVGSELVQKFIGEGAKLVKEIFLMAKEKSPAIIFIDEIDALASKRIDIGTSGEREVQRTFMQLLAELDGFKPLGNVKVIGCTNREDILDPAVIRPGRLDRLIEVPNPDKDGLREIFKIHTRKMTLGRKIDLDKIFKRMKEFSGAEVKAVCTEAGYFAIRKNKTKITEDDFLEAVKKVKKDEEKHSNLMYG